MLALKDRVGKIRRTPATVRLHISYCLVGNGVRLEVCFAMGEVIVLSLAGASYEKVFLPALGTGAPIAREQA